MYLPWRLPLNRQPPWDVLLGASRNTLQSYELSRLNHAANIGRKSSICWIHCGEL
jgi:hypothetical protein